MQAQEPIDLQKYAILAASVWLWVKIWVDRLSRIVEPIIKQVEQLSQDGVIDKAERKTIAMTAIAEAEKRGDIRLNFITRFLVGRVVDYVAGKLPDFKINLKAAELVETARVANVKLD